MKEPYPIYLVLKDKPVVVIGGGNVAERKILGLLDTGAKITVIAPRVTDRIKSLVSEGRLRLEQRSTRERDLAGQPVVFVATDSDEINRRVSSLARGCGALVNCVDTPEECDFFVPSFFRRGSLSFAISTGGRIPALAKRMREKLQGIFGEEYAEYVELLAMGRERIIEATPHSYRKKKELIEKLIDTDLISLLREGKKKEAVDLVEGFLQEHYKRPKPKG
jgi:precorrin-2 dehydrogenase/sirohydrochlorin ferrochelatase